MLRILCVGFTVLCALASGLAQTGGMGAGSVSGRLVLTDPVKHIRLNQQAVIWLVRLNGHETAMPMKDVTLTQQNKKFSPHLLAVTVGTLVAFPNKDPFFHNVFSIYQGKPFDLGLYESGATRSVRFTNPGVSYIFCNIHPEMSAVVVALRTPYFTSTDAGGEFRIDGVPPGPYELNIWYEGMSDEDLSMLSRKLNIASGEVKLPPINALSSGPLKQHKNKYGEDYRTHDKDRYNF